jgi:hypothetical protein
VAQSEGLEFKPQYCKKKEKTKFYIVWNSWSWTFRLLKVLLSFFPICILTLFPNSFLLSKERSDPASGLRVYHCSGQGNLLVLPGVPSISSWIFWVLGTPIQLLRQEGKKKILGWIQNTIRLHYQWSLSQPWPAWLDTGHTQHTTHEKRAQKHPQVTRGEPLCIRQTNKAILPGKK